MFSALKKLVGSDAHDLGRVGVPDGMQAMGQSLQRKFAKGVQYNMKVIIKGDRNTGKTTLFHRLQGDRFKEEYIPTQAIQVASIQWNYKATDDVVKVEVWDVVDKGKPKKHSESLKLENDADEEDPSPCLDASFLDVYKGTNGVVMLLDITKQWTWSYVERELPKVPNHIPVLVMGNLRDMGEHRTVQEDDIRYYIDHFDRPTGSAPLKYAESSMKNGYGLKYLHTFFNIPYLQLQRETLLRQLERNQLETDTTVEELQLRMESEDQNYDMYLQGLESKKIQKKTKKLASPQATSLNLPNGLSSSTAGSSTSSTPAKISPAHSPNESTPSGTPPTSRRDNIIVATSSNQSNLASTPTEETAKDPATSQSLTQKFSKWFSSSDMKIEQGRKDDGKAAVIEPPAEIITKPGSSNINNVDDFVPDEGLDGSFFEDEAEKANTKKSKKKSREPAPPPKPVKVATDNSDSEEEFGNPMVANFQEELDSEDEHATLEAASHLPSKPTKISSKDIELSSDEDRPAVTGNVGVSSSDEIDGSLAARNPSSHYSNPNRTFSKDIGLKLNHSGPDFTRSNEEKNRIDSKKLSLDIPDGETEKKTQYNRSSSSEQETTTSPSSAGLQLHFEDLNFLENLSSKSTKSSSTKKSSSHTNVEFDTLVTIAADEDISETETSTTTNSTTSSKKKKKHKSREKDEDKSSKKHKHKKHRDKDKEGNGDKEERRKKKKHKKKEESVEEGEGSDKDDLERFLEGGEYEAF